MLIWWFVGIFGMFGFHRFYLGKYGTGLLWMFTGGLMGIGCVVDLLTIGSQVDQHNALAGLGEIRKAISE